MKKKSSKVSIVIPIYKPEIKILKKIRSMLKKQTIKAEIIEMWNNPQAVSLNKGIKKAKGEIVVMLFQDCVPENKYWLERLIKPLENKEVAVSCSDLYLPKWYWKKYPFLTRILTINERIVKRPGGWRACAYRKKDLIKIQMIDEELKSVTIDEDLWKKIKKLGKMVHPEVIVNHVHSLNNSEKLALDYYYARLNGKLFKKKLFDKNSLISILRATPLLGILPIIYVFPFKTYFYLFPLYLLLSPLSNLIYIFGFWKGFLFDKEKDKK